MGGVGVGLARLRQIIASHKINYMVVEVIRYWHKNGQIDQQRKREVIKAGSCLHENLHNEIGPINKRGKKDLFSRWYCENCLTKLRDYKLIFNFYNIQK